MGSDQITMPKSEWLSNSGRSVRLFAYSCAISGNENGSLSTDKNKEDTGIAGLRKELEKTKLDV